MGDLLYCVTSLLIFDVPLNLCVYINRSSSITCYFLPSGMYISFCISNELSVVFAVYKNVIVLIAVISEALPVTLSKILVPIKSPGYFADFWIALIKAALSASGTYLVVPYCAILHDRKVFDCILR